MTGVLVGCGDEEPAAPLESGPAVEAMAFNVDDVRLSPRIEAADLPGQRLSLRVPLGWDAVAEAELPDEVAGVRPVAAWRAEDGSTLLAADVPTSLDAGEGAMTTSFTINGILFEQHLTREPANVRFRLLSEPTGDRRGMLQYDVPTGVYLTRVRDLESSLGTISKSVTVPD